MSEPDYEPPSAYVQFPLDFHKRVDIRRIHRKWPHTTLWLFSVCCAAKDARANGALRVGGCPISPEDIDAIPCWEPIQEEWVHDMIAAGLFGTDATGAVVVTCRSQFIKYDSDSPEARRERKAKSRANLAAKAGAPASRTGHEESRPVTTRSQYVTSGHEMSRVVTAGHDTIQSNPIQVNSIQSKSIQSIDPSADGTNERMNDGVHLSSEELWQAIGQAKDAALLDLSNAFAGSADFKRQSRRIHELIDKFAEKAIRDGHTGYEVETAIQFGGLATAWAHRDGPGVTAPANHLMACCADWLHKVTDREVDRAACYHADEPDPGPLEWTPPDEEAMHR